MSILQRITSENSSDVRRPKQPLVLKKISDSFTETFLPFKDNRELREEYINYYGEIRLGKVLEDLDRLAGAVAYKHASDSNGDLAPIVFVTASVDRIDLKAKLSPNRNYRLAGTVTYVGFSSLEIYIQVQPVPEPGAASDPEPNLVARFTMVGRDKYTGKASQVNPLLLEDESQRRLVKVSEQIKEHKKTIAQTNLYKRPPSEEERLVIHQLWLETNKYQDNNYGSHVSLPNDMIWLDKTVMDSVTVCFPSERNVHNKIFGGYLMRLAHELSFANGSVFTQSRPSYVSLDDFSFQKPVNIGSILKLSSQVVYSEPENKTFQVAVSADVIDNLKNTTERTNTFYFNFCCPNGLVRRVVPRSYKDMMKYLEGRRRSQTGKIISKLQSAMR
ncbi:Thioesterase/thiol ester dehydrase-isomerase [Martensiomyces pterosporus]|nr:Thioesterase/thiol ester dehydrase-isomerase [Martensiomyces pterosporus]